MAGLAHKFISILHFDTFSKLLLTISVFFLISILIYIFWKKREQKALSLMLITATDENKSLNKINDLMLSSLSMVDVLNILINRISKDTKDSCANIFNLSEQREALLPFIVAASCRKEIESLNINKTDNPEIFESIFKKMNYEIPSHSKAGNLAPFTGGIFIPLIKGTKINAVLAVFTINKQRTFSASEKNYFESFASQITVILENKHLIDSNNESREEIAAVNALTEIGQMSLGIEETLNVLLCKFVSITNAASGKLFLNNLHSGDPELQAQTGFKYERENEQIDILLAKETTNIDKAIFLKNKLCLVLRKNRKPFGCILIYKDNFREKDLNRFVSMAEKSSMVILSAYAHESSANLVNDLSAVSYLGNMILSTVNLDEVLNLVVRSISEILQAKGCVLRLLDDKKINLVLYAAFGLSSKYLNRGKLAVKDSTEGRTIETRQIVAIPDIENEPYEFKSEAQIENIKSLICVPLIARDTIIGVLTVFFPSKRIITDNDKKLILIYASQTAIAIENARLFSGRKNMYLNVIKSFAGALDAKDNYTRGHSEEVTNYAVQIAHHMKMSEADIELLRFSAALHDIGKIGIDDSILKKTTKLTSEEYENIKKHPVIASTILENIEEFRDVSKIIIHHHERYDGKGYPFGIKGNEIPLLSRIITVVDAYEAMTSDRPYRSAMNNLSALQEMENCKGTQFDPEIVDIFKKLVEKKIPNDKTIK